MLTWSSRTWTDFRRPPVRAMLVAGAIEQHGPHLPLVTDVLIPERLAQATATSAEVTLLPTLPFGARSHTRTGGGDHFPGGLFVPDRVLEDVVESVVIDAVDAGVGEVFVLSWHYENAQPLWSACRAAHAQRPKSRVTLIDSPGDLMPSSLIDDYPGTFPGWAAEHAAVVETSLMMHLAPELVRDDSLPDKIEYDERPWDVWPDDGRSVPASGVFAPVTGSTAVYGARLFDSMVQGLTQVVTSGT